jgi:hypothetical protein
MSLRLAFFSVLLLAVSFSPSLAQESAQYRQEPRRLEKFVPFDEFLEEVKTAKFEEYRRLAGAKVESAEAFEDMRAHILRMYEGVKQEGSFVLDEQFADCITIESQPSVRELGIRRIATPPVSSTFGYRKEVRVPGVFKYAESPLKLGLKDRYGHPVSCRAGTIPFARITLEKLARYRTLSDFFAKSPRERGRVNLQRDKPEFLPDWDATHLHAYASQNVTNYGGNSWLNLWNPSGDFSLSQQWYTGGTGSSTQTAEGGWQVLADKYNTNNAVLFIYWTADNYQKTGCYNLDCSGFVQTNNNWYLGGTWNHYSTTGGDQWGFDLQWKLYSGNWWLFLKGPGDYEAVGYLPTSVYNGGQMSKNATSIIYGGETTRKTGDSWPQMGSGELASQGWQHAAFQNTIFSIPRDENDGVGVWADMTATDEAFTSCYTINLVPASNGGNWGTYFFFGGPSGTTCH